MAARRPHSSSISSSDNLSGSLRLSRRSVLAGFGIGAAWLSTGCGMLRHQAQSLTGPLPASWTSLPHNADAAALALHILNRTAFGPRPGDVARVALMGAAAYLEEQLADKITEDPTVTWRVGALEVQQAEQDAPDLLSSLSDRQLLTETQQAALLRAIYSRHQLREVVVDFWTNHFNIYALKNDGREFVPTDTEHVLRPHALGAFRDLVFASAHSPAMLAYLDNNQNRRGPAKNSNENYARELLELHTLGVKSGYSQNDIHEVARCFTGWTVTGGFTRGQFHYSPEFHDEDAKYIPFLGLHLASLRQKERQGRIDGLKDGERVLEALAHHPATAHFIARKLCRRFLGGTPDAIVEKAANAYLRNNTDIRATLRPILLDGLTSPQFCRPVIKRPLDMVASSLRALAADTDGGAYLQKHLENMGQPLYQWPMPDGFPEKNTAWTGGLLPRWNFAIALATNTIGGTTIDLNAPIQAFKAHSDSAVLDTLMETVYNRPHAAPELAAVRTHLTDHIERARRDNVPDSTLHAECVALLLSAPPFQWK